jgi:dTDP-4-dehydrorhamnose reductase
MIGPLLVTGSYGQLGRAVLDEASARGIATEGRDIDTLDISDPKAVDRWISTSRPGVVVNCAAFTAVDDCESREDEARVVNATAVDHLARACDAVDATLIHVSTDYVFDGTADRPYREDDPVSPIGAYGRTKLLGEQAAAGARRHLIVRTAWLYGHGGRHFVEAIRGQVERGTNPLRVVGDQHGSPTFSVDLAAAILDLAERDAVGIVHAVNRGATTWHGFAEEIVQLLGVDVEVRAVTTDEFPRPAPRPAYSVLDTTRLEQLLGRRMPSWQDALARYLEAACES